MTQQIFDPAFERARDLLSASCDRKIETHCALIFLQGEEAFKMKKPVDLGYLDYTTQAKRRWALEREARFNKDTAPEIYLGLVEIDGEPVLKMRRFADDSVLSLNLDKIDSALSEVLGREIARFHSRAEVRPDGGGAHGIDYVLKSNARLIRDEAAHLGEDLVECVLAATEAEFKAVKDLLDARQQAGFCRRCHGDLHLGNVFVKDGQPILFDCIEFNDDLSRIDVLYDIAFTLMDLWFRGRQDAANRVLNAYLDEAARKMGDALWTGLRALPLFMSVRAAVRCHVSAQAGQKDLARAYLEAAGAFLQPQGRFARMVGGLSGSGKSTYSRRLAPNLGRAPGAVVLRSDEIRKRLWGYAPLEPLPKDAYAPGESDRVYAELLREAKLVLSAGQSVILDAAYLKPEERDLAQACLKELEAVLLVDVAGVWLEADPDVLRARVAARTGDASDADVAVLEAQLTKDLGPIHWQKSSV